MSAAMRRQSAARSPLAKTITAAAWQVSGCSKTITAGAAGVTKANPAVVTATAHGLVGGDKIWISGVTGMTQLNNKPYIVSFDGPDGQHLPAQEITTATTSTPRPATALSPHRRQRDQEMRGEHRQRQRLRGSSHVGRPRLRQRRPRRHQERRWHDVRSIPTHMTSTTPRPGDGTWQVSGVTSNTFVLSGTMPVGNDPDLQCLHLRRIGVLHDRGLRVPPVHERHRPNTGLPDQHLRQRANGHGRLHRRRAEHGLLGQELSCHAVRLAPRSWVGQQSLHIAPRSRRCRSTRWR